MNDTTLNDLRSRTRGHVLTAGDHGYDDARMVYNFMHDCRPAAVVQCADAADVIAALEAAQRDGLELAVRGGGHSVPGFGTCDDGLVVDLSPMHWVQVDPVKRTARVGGGATLGDLDHATHAFGLATTGGIISTTGVGGLTLGGGIGYLARRYGLSCDNLLSADVVTADGRLVTASEDQHPELFWALRGGGGNFGVVTAFEFTLHPVAEIVGGPLFYELARAPEVLSFFNEYIADAPEELGAFFAFQIAPPLPFIPESRHGETMCAMITCWAGDPARAEKVLAPFREVAPVVAEHVGPMPYPALNSAFDALVPRGLQHYWKAEFLPEVAGDSIAAHVEHGAKLPCVNSTVHFYPINGAVHRVAPEKTAFPWRDQRFALVIAGMWPDAADNEANIRWVRDYYDAVHPYGADAGYVNFMSGDDAGRVQNNYRGSFPRLARVKTAWDPGNLFRRNQNIVPADE